MRSVSAITGAVGLTIVMAYPGGYVRPAAAYELDGTGGVSVNAGKEWTRDPLVEVSLPVPSGSQGIVRLSNDGQTWSSPISWAAEVTWSLIASDSGGTDADGQKTVYVEWQDGTGWQAVGNDAIMLDREPPRMHGDLVLNGGRATSDKWQVELGRSPGTTYEDLSNQGSWTEEFSIDGNKTWWRWDNPYVWPWAGRVDFRTMAWGGNWDVGERAVCIRYTDPAGNASDASCDTIDLQPVPTSAESGPLIRFEIPRPAVTGELFTLRPVYPPGYALPSNASCRWILRWGDWDSVYGLPNEHFGQVWIERKATEDACGEWTFTLPYTPGLLYKWEYYVTDSNGIIVYAPGPSDKAATFSATVGTQQRGIPRSTIGLAYLLPDKYTTAVGEPVTYTLHASEGFQLPPAAWWWSSNDGEQFSQWGGKTFTFTPTKEGAWWTGWTHEYPGGYLRAEFDPPADKRPPVVTAPRAVSASGSTIGDRLPVTLAWTARDPKLSDGRPGAGLKRVELQVSRNGGTWSPVSLPSATATTQTLNLLPSGSYRYRVRAVDRVGNRSGWATGATFRPRLIQQTSSAVVYTGSWANRSDAGFSGGSLQETTSADASAKYTFTGRGIAWIATVGSGEGLARVYIDGTLERTIDLSSIATNGHRKVVFSRSWSSRGDHTVRVVVLGTLGRPAASVDAFVVLR